eukprot:SAG11_NODE_9132_length_940_cov_0.662307_1_plen_149_part_01
MKLCVFVATRYGGVTDGSDSAATAVVNSFYAAVDTKDFDSLAALIPDGYTANFGPGCVSVQSGTLINKNTHTHTHQLLLTQAVVGGSTHRGEAVLSYDEYAAMLDAAPPREGGTIERDLLISADGSVVTNHYTLPDGSHGTAVHYISNA